MNEMQTDHTRLCPALWEEQGARMIWTLKTLKQSMDSYILGVSQRGYPASKACVCVLVAQSCHFRVDRFFLIERLKPGKVLS